MQPGGAQGEQINFHVAERGVTQRSAPEIDDSVMVDETIPVEKWGQCANLDRMQERISKKRVLRPLAEKRGQIARPHRRPYDKAG